MDYLDPLEENNMQSSTPDLSTNPSLDAKKVKKKKHFGVFHRHHHKNKHQNELDLPADRQQSLLASSLPASSWRNSSGRESSPSHLSLENTWNHGTWKQLEPEMRSSSVNSSNLSVESGGGGGGGREMSDEELVESLVNPQGKSSSLASSVTPVSKASCSQWLSAGSAAAIVAVLCSCLLSGGE